MANYYVIILPMKEIDSDGDKQSVVLIVDINALTIKIPGKSLINGLTRAFSYQLKAGHFVKKPLVVKSPFQGLEEAKKAAKQHFLDMKKDLPVMYEVTREDRRVNQRVECPFEWVQYWRSGSFFPWNSFEKTF
jgi:hypothetical protein